MFCSCCEFGSSRSPLAAKASILDREHCARFHCDSAWSNLKASVVTSDLSRMLIVLYCDFQASGDCASAAERSSPRLRRRKPDPPQPQAAPAPAAGGNDARPADEAPTAPLHEGAQGEAGPAEGAAARTAKDGKRCRG